MKLLVGLGNPDTKNLDNRHNIGYRMVGHWVNQQNERFHEKFEFRGLTAKFSFQNIPLIALLPTTYMNRSGEAISKVMQYFQIPIEDVIVLHDELDIAAGTFRVKIGGGHAGHNGLRSIHPLGDNYVRIRLGIGRPPHPEMEVPDFVLSNFTLAEKRVWEELYPTVAQAIEMCITGKVREAMNLFNRRISEE